MDYLPHPEDLLVLLPGAVAAALLLLVSGLAAARQRKLALALAFAALSFAVANGITYWRIKGVPEFPGVQSSERVFYGVAIFAVVVAATATLTRRWTVWTLRAGLLLGLVYFVVHPLHALPADSTSHVSLVTLLGLAAASLGWWIATSVLAARVHRVILPLALCLSVGCVGQILLMNGSASLAQLLGTASMALGLTVLLVRWLPDARLPETAIGSLVAVLIAVGCDAYFFMVDAPPSSCLALAAAAPLALSVSLIPKVRAMRPGLRLTLPMLLVLGVLGFAFALGQPPPGEIDDPYLEYR